MGVTLKCKRTGNSVTLGMGGFYRFRQKVAELACDEFGRQYHMLLDAYRVEAGPARDDLYREFDKVTDKLIRSGKLNAKVADFCLQSDCGGRIRYGACKEILKAIGSYDDQACYGYAGRRDCASFLDLKHLLEECVTKRSDLLWL